LFYADTDPLGNAFNPISCADFIVEFLYSTLLTGFTFYTSYSNYAIKLELLGLFDAALELGFDADYVLPPPSLKVDTIG